MKKLVIASGLLMSAVLAVPVMAQYASPDDNASASVDAAASANDDFGSFLDALSGSESSMSSAAEGNAEADGAASNMSSVSSAAVLEETGEETGTDGEEMGITGTEDDDIPGGLPETGMGGMSR